MPSSRRFWIKAAALGALLLGASLWLEAGLRTMPTIYRQKLQGVSAHAATAEVLVLGASQGNQGLDPAAWPVPAYNLACVGQDAYYDAELFKAWSPRLPRLKAVVLPISLVSFDSSLLETAETWRCFAYSQAYGLPNESPEQRQDLRNWSALALNEPWPALQAASHGFKDPRATVLSADGFEAVSPLASEDDADMRVNALTANKRMRYHLGIKKASRVEGNLAQFHAINELAQARGVQVLYVVFPVSGAYAQAAPTAELAARKRSLDALVGKGVTMKDYFKDGRFGWQDFADVDHLSRVGAEKFSAILWNEALGPMLSAKR